MPSGSHGGSAGSHSSGGASFGGGSSHSSSGSSSGGFRFSHGPVFIFGHRFSGTAVSFFFSILAPVIFAIILGIVFGVVLNGYKSEIGKIKEDYAYYQVMINNAKTNPSLVKEANVTDAFLGTGGKYYITYSITYDTNKKLEGYTYSVYTREEAAALLNGGEGVVEVAVNNVTVNANTDSITMDFDGRNYKDDGDYINAVSSRKNIVIVFSVIYGIIAVVIIVFIIRGIRAIKKEKQAELDKKAKETKEEQEKENAVLASTCPYCGSKLSQGQTKCPNCGAGLRKK